MHGGHLFAHTTVFKLVHTGMVKNHFHILGIIFPLKRSSFDTFVRTIVKTLNESQKNAEKGVSAQTCSFLTAARCYGVSIEPVFSVTFARYPHLCARWNLMYNKLLLTTKQNLYSLQSFAFMDGKQNCGQNWTSRKLISWHRSRSLIHEFKTHVRLPRFALCIADQRQNVTD